MAISLHWEELSAKYFIYVDVDSRHGWVPFRKDMEAKAFLVKRKAF